MCDGDRGYFVFSFKNGEVDSLLGSSFSVPRYPDLPVVEEVVKLPKAFMLGSSFKALVIKSLDGSKNSIAYIPIGSRPLAL